MLVCLVGAVGYLLCGRDPTPSRTSTDLKEICRIAFFVGLFFTVWILGASRVLTFPPLR